MHPFYFGTNVKMHQTHADTQRFVRVVAEQSSPVPERQLFLMPPFTSLAGLPELAAESGMWIGAQNMHDADEGEFTGEIAPGMLRALGVEMVLLGHAERRRHFGETDGLLNRKVRAAFAHGMRPLLCVGEDAQERGFGIAHETVARQLKVALHGIQADHTARLIVAYEPVWSIGTSGRPALVEEVLPVLEAIRHTLGELFGARAKEIALLYGGSVNESNCADYAALPVLDGLFVGRAVRQPEDFVHILNLAYQARAKSR